VAAGLLCPSAELSFNAIAKQAEVGVGTVYRHFPTPEALILAVYQREVRHLVDVVPRLLAAHPPEVAFRAWTTGHLAHYLMTKRGLADALRIETSVRGELPASAYHAMVGAVSTLLTANADAGTVRDDLNKHCACPGRTHSHSPGAMVRVTWSTSCRNKVVGKVFLIVTDDPDDQIITVKCEPEHARAQERRYASITPGRYLDKRHWISLGPGPGITQRLVAEAVTNSYDLVVERLPRRDRPSAR
jgi:predicted DNA-binding protein (MmcQ/YjbR family)